MVADNDRLLLKVFYDYHVRNLSQNDIAARHLISRKKVQRLLDKGRDENLVEVKIRFPSRIYGELESVLEDRYGLLEAIVTDIDDADLDNRAVLLRNVSDMAADYFLRVLSNNMTVSITWSSHVAQMLEEAVRKLGGLREKPKNLHFVLTVGTVVGSEPDIRTMEAARRIAAELNSDLQVLMVPSMTTSDAKRALMCDPQITDILDMAKRAGAAFFGVGSIEGDSLQVPMVQKHMPDMITRLRDLGAVGDINGHFFDAAGRAVKSELDERLVGLNIQDIHDLPLSVGIATGPRKYNAIKAVLAGGILNVLITDVGNARRLVEEGEKK